MQLISSKVKQEQKWLCEKNDPLGIVQETEIKPN